MKTIVYFPEEAPARLALQKRIARVHAEAVIATISAQPLSRDEKNLLLDAIIAKLNVPQKKPQ